MSRMSCTTREQAEKEFRLAFSEAAAESDHLFCEIVDECADISNNGLTKLTDMAEAAAEPLFAAIADAESERARQTLQQGVIEARAENAESELAAANARIAELEEALRGMLQELHDGVTPLLHRGK